jgi:hypothetical protein
LVTEPYQQIPWYAIPSDTRPPNARARSITGCPSSRSPISRNSLALFPTTTVSASASTSAVLARISDQMCGISRSMYSRFAPDEVGLAHVRVVDAHLPPLADEHLDERHHRALAQVVGAGLEGEAEHADASPLRAITMRNARSICRWLLSSVAP